MSRYLPFPHATIDANEEGDPILHLIGVAFTALRRILPRLFNFRHRVPALRYYSLPASYVRRSTGEKALHKFFTPPTLTNRSRKVVASEVGIQRLEVGN